MRSLLSLALVVPAVASAQLSTGTVVHPADYASTITTLVETSVTLTTNADGLLVFVGGDAWRESIQVEFDPGGGDEVIKAYADRIGHAEESGNYVQAFFFNAAELPGTGAYDLEINFDGGTDGTHIAYMAIPIETGGAGSEVVQSDDAAGSSPSSLTNSLTAPITSGSLVAQMTVNSSDGLTTSFGDLSTEEFDVQGSGGDSMTFAGAFEVGPTEDQDYVVTPSSATGNMAALAVEIGVLSSPGFDATVTYDAIDHNTVRIVVDANASTDDIHAACWAVDTSAPADGAAVEAGSGALGTATAVATGASQNLDVDLSNTASGFPHPEVDCYVVAEAD